MFLVSSTSVARCKMAMRKSVMIQMEPTQINTLCLVSSGEVVHDLMMEMVRDERFESPESLHLTRSMLKKGKKRNEKSRTSLVLHLLHSNG